MTLTTLETGPPFGAGPKVVHGCRQLGSGDVGLSPATSATPVACCQHLVGDSCETAGDKPEEGGDDVKSSCPLCSGLHTCYIGRYKGLRYREVERIPKSRSRFGLEAETRLHEGGVASNPGSATPGGIRSRALYTPPVTPRKQATPEAGDPTLGREPSKVGLVIGVKSQQGSRTGR